MVWNNKLLKQLLSIFNSYTKDSLYASYSELKELNLLYKEGNIYFCLVNKFLGQHVITFKYCLENQEYPDNLENTYQKYFLKDFYKIVTSLDGDIEVTITENYLKLSSGEAKFHLNVLSTTKETKDILDKYLNDVQTNISSFEGFLSSFSNTDLQTILNQIKYRSLDSQDNQDYIGIFENKIVTQQFNYVTSSNLKTNLNKRFPTVFLTTLLQVSMLDPSVQYFIKEDTFYILSNTISLSVSNLDERYKEIDTFKYDKEAFIALDSQDILNALKNIKAFSTNKEFFLDVLDDKLVVKNFPVSENIIGTKAEFTLDANVLTNQKGTFSVRTDILIGLISLCDSDVKIYLETADYDDETYILYVTDTFNKNFMVIERIAD